MSDYDSTDDTLEHIGKVRENLIRIVDGLAARGLLHDASKLRTPEKEAFDEMTPTYGAAGGFGDGFERQFRGSPNEWLAIMPRVLKFRHRVKLA